jgi:glutathione peroxidase
VSVYDFTVKTIRGKEQSLADYKGKVLLIVNTASKCGFTPQYKELQELYEQYRDRGFVVLGFPCNQFGHQEPGTEEEIEQFCQVNYGVTFPMFAKVDVNGENAHPLFQYLKEKASGLLGTKVIKWNFTKFLVDRNGNVVARFASQTRPSELKSEIEKLL